MKDAPVVIVPDNARVFRVREIAKLVNEPGASLRSVAFILGVTHTRLWRALRDAGYKPTRGYGIPGDFERQVRAAALGDPNKDTHDA